jgi:uncharacterized membrane protein YkvA (DUF1232 family)
MTPPPSKLSARARNIREALWPIFQRAPKYFRLAWLLVREPSIPQKYKLGLYSLVVYQVTPIHLLLTPVPVLGQIDGLLFLLFAIRQMVTHCPPLVLQRCFVRSGLSTEQMQEDLLTVARIGGAAVSKAVRRTIGNLKFAGRVATRVGLKSIARFIVATEKPRPRPFLLS